jgi:hypothetical protein
MKLPAIIEKELKNCDVPFIIKRGARHWKIFVGDALCGVFPMNCKSKYRRAELNLRAQIRRQAKRSQKGE